VLRILNIILQDGAKFAVSDCLVDILNTYSYCIVYITVDVKRFEIWLQKIEICSSFEDLANWFKSFIETI